ncbi:DUF2306 domain-containing protein [Luteibacter rhizovicinus]|uniref:DUF2306 domain-containing protein n=1 Tax=Luteibacter rhizovicinus TaxID=242606 RepID=UPI001404CA55|nr:DUF2306 domain-containing protein [Luteibacter rhizovicinus]
MTLFTMGSIAVAAYAFTYFRMPHNIGNPFDANFATSGFDVPGHFFGAGLALLLAPLQLSRTVRRRWPRLHRLGGWLSAGGILIGALSGLSLSTHSQGGAASGIGFALLAPTWLFVTGNGIRYALAGDTERHRRWMSRSAALTFSAVTLRLILAAGTILGMPFGDTYIFAAWACWPINLAVCEIILRWPGRRMPEAIASVA